MSSYKSFRDIHLWVGLILLVPIGVIATTGFLWNHEKALGIKKEMKRHKPVGEPVVNTLSAEPGLWQSHATAIDGALAMASSTWGAETPVERVELKHEPGYGLIVKVKATKESMAMPEEIVWSVQDGAVVDMHGDMAAGRDWAKLVHDLHTGKFFGDKFGFLWADSGAIALGALGLTGVVLYLIPIFKKRAKKSKAAIAPRKPVSASALELARRPARVVDADEREVPATV